jgi:hypothetical protein
MIKIKSVFLQYLRNEAHYEFLWLFNRLMEELPEIKTRIATLYQTFLQLLEMEKQLLDAARASALTQQIADAARRMERAVAGIKAGIRSAHFSPDATVVEAARVLHLRLKAFGNIRGKAYEEEVAAVQILLGDLKTAFELQVSCIGLQSWVAELTAAEASFTGFYLRRNSETAIRPQKRMTDVRHQIDKVYHSILTVVKGAAITDAGKGYDGFIAKLNVQVDYFNEHNHRHARKDVGAGDSCVVSPIATQPCTGKAITPIPEVFYREEGKETVELVFTKDFTVAYRNNIDAGTASLILYGKGMYRGQKTVTFNIFRN